MSAFISMLTLYLIFRGLFGQYQFFLDLQITMRAVAYLGSLVWNRVCLNMSAGSVVAFHHVSI